MCLEVVKPFEVDETACLKMVRMPSHIELYPKNNGEYVETNYVEPPYYWDEMIWLPVGVWIKDWNAGKTKINVFGYQNGYRNGFHTFCSDSSSLSYNLWPEGSLYFLNCEVANVITTGLEGKDNVVVSEYIYLEPPEWCAPFFPQQA